MAYNVRRPKKPRKVKAPTAPRVQPRAATAPQVGAAPPPPVDPGAPWVNQPTGPPPGDPSQGVNYPVTPGPDTQANRINAGETYGVQVAGYNAGKAQAAYGYSDPTNPNSAIAQIERSKNQRNKSQDARAGAGNTFFSGMNLKAHTDIGDEAQRQRLGAQERYNNAVSNYDNLIAAATAAYHGAGRNADAQDAMNALAQPAAPQEPAAPDWSPEDRAAIIAAMSNTTSTTGPAEGARKRPRKRR